MPMPMASFTRAAASAIRRASQYSTSSGNTPSCRLHVSGLSPYTTDQTLHAAFGIYGRVLRANVVYNRKTGFPKGYGFVTYASEQEAAAGINGMDGQFLGGLVIFAAYATPKVRRGATSPEPKT
ncbi:organelle RRM domain-containing protein 2, mitochondrial-like [Apium graveolens]|uniref:organelle RRM domain-containing protein 2, mitochondrial-like n=1 Tax=Apium graveolens TaxID=4045 RepID=UPI003D7A379D